MSLSVTTADDDAVAVAYADPGGGTRAVRHAALAGVELTVHRQGQGELTLATSRGAYEYGSARGLPGVDLEPLPEG